MRPKLCFFSLFSIFVAAEAQFDYDCDGGSEEWGGTFEPAKVKQEIVDFAVSQFSGMDNGCYNAEAENFQSKVICIISRGEG